MNHKLNLNGPGSRLFGIAMLTIALSILVYGLSRVLEGYRLRVAWLSGLAGFLAVSGALLLVTLVILLVIEAFQDRAMDQNYRKQRSRRLPVGNGSYECQYCGSRKVHAEDRTCPICGRDVEN